MRSRVLESMRCDTQEMLIAARDNYGDDIDVADSLEARCNKEENK